MMGRSIVAVLVCTTLLVVAASASAPLHHLRRPEQQQRADAAASDLAGGAPSSSSHRRHHHGHGRPWPPVTTNRPLIGILSQPGDPARSKDSYIAASYVKFVEAGGARVVPFLHDMPADEIKRRFALVHGFLIPGGAATLRPGHTFFDAAAAILDLAAAEAAQGGFFPVHGVCLGFEALSIALARNASLLTPFDAEDTAAPLLFTPAAWESQLYGRMGKRALRALGTRPYARESHSWGVSLENLVANEALASAVNVLSLSADNTDGRVYVSSWEHTSLPVWATQFHPEKNAFEWGDALHIPHEREAVMALSQGFANVLVDAARRAGPGHGVSLEAEGKGALDDLLIYNTPPVFTGRHDGPEPPFFDQAYVFGPWKGEEGRRGDGVVAGGVGAAAA